jgi:hypothetical protein
MHSLAAQAQISCDPASLKAVPDAVPAARWALLSTNDLLLATADKVDPNGLMALTEAGDPRAQQLVGYALTEYARG